MLYISLLDTFSHRGWEEWISIGAPLLMVLANTPNATNARQARDALVEAGGSGVQAGQKKKAV